MRVVATAGHVDHGKSTLVRALTGSDPDRLAEEHRRGLSIELGYCWTELPPVGTCAFVDVPGHERFVRTMLAGVGPVPAVLFTVAADDGWMPQAAEHLAALEAFGVRHGVVAVTRCDLAEPASIVARTTHELGRTGLAGSPVIPVSAPTGSGLPELRRALVAMLDRLPAPNTDADVRLWVDRCFVVHGAGTVVTGTLRAGTIRRGDALLHGTEPVRVRGVQTLGREVDQVGAVARVALRLGRRVPDGLDRGGVLVTPEAWHHAEVVDVRVPDDPAPPTRPVLHIGAAAVTCRYRPLGGDVARLTLSTPLPLRVGDRTVLRDAGAHRVWGATVLDPAPPALRRRGAGRQRALDLRSHRGVADLADELGRRGWARMSLLRRIGIATDDAATTNDAADVAVEADDWLFDRRLLPALSARLTELVAARRRDEPLSPGLPVAAVARDLGLPTERLIPKLLSDGLRINAGRVSDSPASALPAELETALDALHQDLTESPFAAPDAARLVELGLDRRAIAAAANADRLLRVADGVVLLPGADRQAARMLRDLPQPFTTSQAKRLLQTTRRVAVPLLELLDRRGMTVRMPDDRRHLAESPDPHATIRSG